MSEYQSGWEKPLQPLTSVPSVPQRDHQIIETMRAWANGQPVWSHDEIVEHFGRDFLMYRIAWNLPLDLEDWDLHKSVARTREVYDLRIKAIHEFGFSIPCKELLDALEAHQPIVEVGAGSGYMTALMRHRGIDVVGTDSGRGHSWVTLRKWDPRQQWVPAKRAVRHYRDRNVFCSWPSLAETWFRQAMRAMRIGQRAIIIEEDCCAEQSTWDYREAAFDMVADIPLPAWPMLNDRAAVWIKKREAAVHKPKERFDWKKEAELWRETDDGPGDGDQNPRVAVDGAEAAQGDPETPAPAAQGQGA
jgi:hypothetical protein